MRKERHSHHCLVLSIFRVASCPAPDINMYLENVGKVPLEALVMKILYLSEEA